MAGFAREFWKRTNPIEAIKGIGSMTQGANLLNLIKADPAFLDEAHVAAKSGDYTTALRKVLSFAAMGLGHDLDTQAEMLQRGKLAEGAGAMAGTAAGFVGPGLAGKALSGARIPAMAANTDPAVVSAVNAGRAAGVPIDAATATGNVFVKGAQKVADESLIGSVVGGRARTAQQAGLATMGEQIASKVNRGAVTGEQAGEAAQFGVQNAVSDARIAANAAYDRLRDIENSAQGQTRVNPGSSKFQSVKLATDVRPTKTAMQPILDRLMAKKAITGTLMGAEGQSAAALDALINGPDFVPLSVADAALSDLKRMARSNNPDLRTAGQGIAAKAVSELHAAVTKAAVDAGPDAVTALTEGRQATIAKYAAADVLKKVAGAKVPKEAVTAFRGMTRDADASIGHLRDVLKQAPDTKPLIARAVLDGLFTDPTVGPLRALTDWQKVGPETKGLLYQPDHIRAIDDFLLLRKKIAENPNMSGSGLVALKGGELAALSQGHIVQTIALPALSALLHSNAGVRLLTQGFRLPATSKAAQSAWLAQVNRAAQSAGTPLPAMAPAFAGQQRQ